MTGPRVHDAPGHPRTAADTWDAPPWLDLPPAAASPGQARAWTRAVLAAWGLGHLTEDAELAVSELVTNAVQASARAGVREPVRVCLASIGTQLLIQVRDGCLAFPVLTHPSLTDEAGRGLMIVDQVAAQAGCHRTPGKPGKVVWCLISGSPAS
jgi:anti-sigma regulatory factor (Ser/Thr protein kinase)